MYNSSDGKSSIARRPVLVRRIFSIFCTSILPVIFNVCNYLLEWTKCLWSSLVVFIWAHLAGWGLTATRAGLLPWTHSIFLFDLLIYWEVFSTYSLWRATINNHINFLSATHMHYHSACYRHTWLKCSMWPLDSHFSSHMQRGPNGARPQMQCVFSTISINVLTLWRLFGQDAGIRRDVAPKRDWEHYLGRSCWRIGCDALPDESTRQRVFRLWSIAAGW